MLFFELGKQEDLFVYDFNSSYISGYLKEGITQRKKKENYETKIKILNLKISKLKELNFKVNSCFLKLILGKFLIKSGKKKEGLKISLIEFIKNPFQIRIYYNILCLLPILNKFLK
jgi:hypothetical protein